MTGSITWKNIEEILIIFFSCWEKFSSIKAMKWKYHSPILEIPESHTHYFTRDSVGKRLLESLYNYISTKATGK